jgi:teichuronic acid biosynthesis glycosyltransferase TuaH
MQENSVQDITIVGYQDWCYAEDSGVNHRDLHLATEIAKLDGNVRVLYISRPVSLAEQILRRKRWKCRNGELIDQGFGYRLYKIPGYGSFYVLSTWVPDLFGPILLGRKWWNSVFRKKRIVACIARARARLGFRNDALLLFTPFAISAIDTIVHRIFGFDVIDNFEKHRLLSLEERRFCGKAYRIIDDRAHVKLGVTQESLGIFRKREGAVVVRNGVHRAWLSMNPPEPPDLARFRGKIVGFGGSISKKFNGAFLAGVAKRMPDVDFVLLGKVLDKDFFAPFKGLGNVHYLGFRNFNELPAYYFHFDAGLILYRQELEHDGDPLKLYEYLSLGTPVATLSAEWMQDRFRDVVAVSDSAEEFADKLRAVLAIDRSAWRPICRKAIREEDLWDSKAKEITFALSQAATGRIGPASLPDRMGTAPAKRDFLIVGYRDWCYAETQGVNVRDLHFATELAKSHRTGKVLFVNRPVSLAEQLITRKKWLLGKAKLVESDHGYRLYEVEESGLYVLATWVPDLILPPFMGRRWWERAFRDPATLARIERAKKTIGLEDDVLLLCTPFGVSAADTIKHRFLAFDVIDNFIKHSRVRKHEKAFCAEAYKKLATKVDLVTCVSEQAKTLFPASRQLVIRNGVDRQWLSLSPPRPAEFSRFKGKVVGFGGNITKKFDSGFLTALAKLMPETDFIVIGQVLDKGSLAGTEGCGNIHYLGFRKFKEIPAYYYHFDAGLILYRSELAHDGDPLKLYEYLSLGTPVISLPAKWEQKRFGEVLKIADTPVLFAAGLREALSQDREAWRPKCRSTLESEDFWDSKAEAILGAIEAKSR